MTKKKPKEITKQELYRLVAKKAKSYSSTMAEVYINALIEVIADELILTGKINVRNLGIFETVESGGYDKHMPSPFSDELQEKYIAPHFRVKFRCAKNFTDSINNKKILSATLRQQQLYNDKIQKALDEEAELYENRELPLSTDIRNKWKLLQKEKEIQKEIEKAEQEENERIIDYKSRIHYADGRRTLRRVDK